MDDRIQGQFVTESDGGRSPLGFSRSEPTDSFPVDTSDVLASMISEFERTGLPQSISFRTMVSWIKMGERATHYIHSYPAKLLPQIAHFFLAANQIFDKNGIVLDPFGGTGTVALEAILSGRNAYYADVNPIARLISSVKTQKISPNELDKCFIKITSNYNKTRYQKIPNVPNVGHWFGNKEIRDLARLKHAIDEHPDSPIKNFILVCFSAVVKKVSNADPRLSVPVRRKVFENPASITFNHGLGSPSVWDAFQSQFHANKKRLLALIETQKTLGIARCVGTDARHLKIPSRWDRENPRSLPDGSVDLIITSPPYAGAQKYIRASSLSLGWLGFLDSNKLTSFEQASIGREHLPKSVWCRQEMTGIATADKIINQIYKKNKLRSAIISTYLLEMKEALAEATRALRPGGHLVLVIGNNEVCGAPFTSSEYLEEILHQYGFTTKLKLIDEIKSRGLMTKRNKSASIIAREWVILLQKGA
ncbi:MAG: hypothetical protein U0P46_02785 [Holophagaceae bacterium]